MKPMQISTVAEVFVLLVGWAAFILIFVGGYYASKDRK